MVSFLPTDASTCANPTTRHSTAHSVASFQTLECSPADDDYDRIVQEQYQLIISPWSSRYRLLDIMRASDLSESLISTTENVCQFTSQADHWLRADPQAPDFLHVRNFSSLVTKQLIKFLAAQRSSSVEPVGEALAIALLMFAVRTINEPTSPVDSLHFAATSWLRHALDMSVLDEAWDPELRLWACTVGAICAAGSRDADSIDRAFVDAARDWGINSLEQLCKSMDGLLWIKSRFDEALGELWTRLEDDILASY
jgi:hypothetical protein